MNIIAVGAGGFFGAILRYILVEWLLLPNGFPLSTMVENLLGCFLLGWFLTMTLQYWKISNKIQLLIGTGAIGSFTTFSTFSVETIMLLHNQHFIMAFGNIVITIFGGILLSAAGVKLARMLSGKKGVAGG